jgi:hypothetical protein
MSSQLMIPRGLSPEKLQLWHQEYKAERKALFQSNEDDDAGFEMLDSDMIENQIQAVQSPVTLGFCDSCRELLDNWPETTRERRSTVVRYCNSIEVEAATRAGCKFCALLWMQLDETGFLDPLRKIERQLREIGKPDKSSLVVINGPLGTEFKTPARISWDFPGGIVRTLEYGRNLFFCPSYWSRRESNAISNSQLLGHSLKAD